MTAALPVAVVQLDASAGAAECAAAASRAIEEAAPARLVVLPEYTSGWAARLGPELAQPRDGQFVQAIRCAARRVRSHVIAGCVLPSRDPSRGRNVTVAIGPDGEFMGEYAKVHLYDAFGARESDYLDAADPVADGAPLVIDVPLPGSEAREASDRSRQDVLRVGVLTCYDLRFPESARRLVDAGADAIVVGAAWASGPQKAHQLRALATARAIENTAFLLLSSQCGRGRTGHSVVLDPRGVALAEAGADGDAVLRAELDLELLAEVRSANPSLAHRRFTVVPGRPAPLG